MALFTGEAASQLREENNEQVRTDLKCDGLLVLLFASMRKHTFSLALN